MINSNVQPPLPFTHKRVLNTSFLIALVSIIFSLLPTLLGVKQGGPVNYALSFASFVIMFLVLLNSMKQYREEELGSYMSFGRAFRFSFFVFIIASFIGSIFFFIQIQFITPGMLDEMMNTQIAEMEKRGMSEEEIEMGMKMTGMMSSPAILALFAFFGSLIWGVIISLIVGATTKRWPPPVRIDENDDYEYSSRDQDPLA